jgi:hypothetical protein
MRMDTGALEQERIARIRQINEKPYLNIKKDIFNGTGPTTLEVNPYPKIVPLSDMTNGMQYKPDINDGSLNQYDNIFQRNVKYSYDSDEEYGPNNNLIQSKKYKENIFLNG